MTSVAVIGGGIAGAVTAMALRKAGLDPVVYEAYPTGADDIGAFLTIMNNGLDALHAVGARAAVVDASFPGRTVEVFDGTGTRLSALPLGGAAGHANSPRTLTRADLYRALHDEAARRDIRIEHGKRLTTAGAGPDGRVTAEFADGTGVEADLLVGADGIHSAVRSLIDPANPGPRYTGLNIVYGYTAGKTAASAPEGYHMIQGGKAFFGFTTAPDGRSWWFARLPRPELDRAEISAHTPEDWRRLTIPFFAGDDTPSAELIEATGDDIVGGNAYDVPSTPVWQHGSMVLVGDAAHAASPAAGQGASMAIEDSVELGRCLRDLPDLGEACRAYELLRRGRVERLVAASAEQGARSAGTGGREWLYQHHIDWDAPVAPAEIADTPS
ncbi:FAD-dependent monooxygenase [Amycolatopsis nigrescens]|uniref:FAD-dependent monooxygenase n=1 Tax=Amycolatopsis nigrescens TaxID=381445 RepID=UPI00036D6022|nr:FAD-dependent monooxygenase [Amycolatopsis nigrescens]